MNAIFLGARVVHILCAALWLGSIFLLSIFVMPVLQQAGTDGGKFMANMDRRGLSTFLASIAGFTVLTGFYLYWHLTGGFDPALTGTLEAKVFGAGGVLGLAALIIGASVVGGSAKKAVALTNQMQSLPEKDRTGAVAEIQRLRQKIVTYGHLVMALVIVTIVLMSIGHYVS